MMSHQLIRRVSTTQGTSKTGRAIDKLLLSPAEHELTMECLGNRALALDDFSESGSESESGSDVDMFEVNPVEALSLARKKACHAEEDTSGEEEEEEEGWSDVSEDIGQDDCTPLRSSDEEDL